MLDGCFYFCTDTGKIYIDYADDDGNLIRQSASVGTETNILQLVYPLGSVYISTTPVNPAVLFGFGTWEQIQDVFLLAAGATYAVGSTGGEAEHMMTVDETVLHGNEKDAAARIVKEAARRGSMDDITCAVLRIKSA